MGHRLLYQPNAARRSCPLSPRSEITAVADEHPESRSKRCRLACRYPLIKLAELGNSMVAAERIVELRQDAHELRTLLVSQDTILFLQDLA